MQLRQNEEFREFLKAVGEFFALLLLLAAIVAVFVVLGE